MNLLLENPVIKFFRSTELKAMFIKLALFILCITLSAIDGSFSFLLIILFSVFVICECSFNSIVWVMLAISLQPFIMIKSFMLLAFIFLLVLLAKTIYSACNKKIKFSDWRVIILLATYVVCVVGLFLPIAQYQKFYYTICTLITLSILVLAIINFTELNLKNIYLIFSTAVAALCVIFNFIQFCGFDMFNNFLLNGESAFNPVFMMGDLERFYLFLADPNYTGGVILLALISLSLLFKDKELKNCIFEYSLFFILSVSLFFTLSKAAFIGYGLLILYILITGLFRTIKVRKKCETINYLVIIGVIFASMLISYQAISAVISRLISFESTATGFESVDNFTTGRLTLWVSYLKKIFASVHVFFFGYGNAAPMLDADTHNIVLSILYHHGFVAILLLAVVYIIGCVYNKKTFSLRNIYAPIIAVIFYLSLSGRLFTLFYVFFFIFTFFHDPNKAKQEKDIQNDHEFLSIELDLDTK